MTHKYIFTAIKSRDFDRFSRLMEIPGYNLDEAHSGVTPLILSAKSGQDKISEKLIFEGANLDLCDGDGRPALLHACQKGYSSIVKQLIQAGCDTKQCSATGDYALHESVSSGDVATVQLLLDCGAADINQSNPVTGYTPLMLALLQEQYSVVKVLLVRGADLNCSVPGGDTALHFAVQVTPLYVIHDLIRAGCDMNKLNSIGETPLIVAVYEGRINVVQLLILSGCQIYEYDFFSPLCIACLQNNAPMVCYLLSEGYDVSRDESVKSNILPRFEVDHPVLLEFILTVRASQPLSLKELSRVKVRRILGPDVSVTSKQLSIPVILKEWVANDNIY